MRPELVLTHALGVLAATWLTAVVAVGQAPAQPETSPPETPAEVAAPADAAGAVEQAVAGDAQPMMPDGSGKDLVARVCTKCHVFERVALRRADQAQWQEIINMMIQRGAEVYTEDEFYTIAGYLAEHLGPTINVNAAGAIDLQLGFWITREEADAIVAYRNEHGAFTTPDDLRNVPGLDFTTKVEPIRDYLIF